jgi:hypothetical protein
VYVKKLKNKKKKVIGMLSMGNLIVDGWRTFMGQFEKG